MSLHTKKISGMDGETFSQECSQLIDWLAGIEMPEDNVKIREAGGCLGGILVGLITTSQASFHTNESEWVARLCEQLETSANNDNQAKILQAIRECAQKAAGAGEELAFEFQQAS